MRQLAADGVTVVLSSHILGEVQQICDSVTIIAGGRRVAHGPVASVLAASDKGEYRVKVFDHRRAAVVLEEAGAVVRAADDHLVVTDVHDPGWITETLARQGLWLTELTPLRPDLEHVFLELTGTMPDPDVHRQVDDPPHTVPAQAANATDEAPRSTERIGS
jgi:ABC-2 type transport system ATP-binding protein